MKQVTRVKIVRIRDGATLMVVQVSSTADSCTMHRYQKRPHQRKNTATKIPSKRIVQQNSCHQQNTKYR